MEHWTFRGDDSFYNDHDYQKYNLTELMLQASDYLKGIQVVDSQQNR